MKKILFILLLITIPSNSLACTCKAQRVIDRYAKSDFVATVNVLSVDSEIDDDYLNLKIEIITLFKGNKIKLLKIRKTKGRGCAIYTPENTKWLIFASKDENGYLTFGYCSGPKQLDKTFDKEKFPNAELNYYRGLEQKMGLLYSLKKEKIRPQNTYNLYTSFAEKSLDKFKGYDIKNEKNSFYELTVNKDLSVKNVKILKEFDNKNLSKELIEFIKKNIHVGRIGKLNEIPNKTKIILGLYFHPPVKERKSVILPYAY